MNKISLRTKDMMKRILIMLLTFISAVSALMSTMSFFAYAEEPRNLDQTDPIEDLKSDPTFDINKYNFNMLGSLEIANFSEYCYSFYTDKKNDFALYVYVFNPQALKIVDSDQNKIQMAVGYDSKGNPNNYEKFNLKLCKFSSDDNYYRLFYKFKVVDHLTNGFGIYDRLSANERRYDVSGIELLTEDSGMVAPETKIATTYKFTGYAKGYGPNYEATESTLKCYEEKLETVELKVNHTYWRSESSNRDVGYQNQLDSVYFTVPNSLLEEYGKLQRIKAEWYEYLTKDIVVTSDEETYNAVKDYIGKSDLSGLEYGLAENYTPAAAGATSLPTGDWYFKGEEAPIIGSPNFLSVLYYLFPTANWCDIKEYDPYGDITLTGGVSGNALYDYIKEYSATHTENLLPIKDGKISADLFESDIDDYRKIDDERGCIKQGYSYYDFDADLDILEWEAYKPEDHSFAENRKMYGFWDALFKNYDKYEDLGFDAEKVTPILMLKESDLSGTAESISNRLFVNYQDVSLIRDVYEEAEKNDETVVLFRFALTDYYSSSLDILSYGFLNTIKHLDNKAYRAKQSVFLDFDIIQLTFNNEGEKTVIPAISSPMDIVNDITTPNTPDNENWWDKFVNFLKTIGAWAITIVGCCLGVGFILVIISAVTKILDARMHIAIKIIFIAPLAVLTLIVGIVVVPWVINLVQSLGGL